MCSEEEFNVIWNKINILRRKTDIDSPKLFKKKKNPAKLGGGSKQTENTCVKDHNIMLFSTTL